MSTNRRGRSTCKEVLDKRREPIVDPDDIRPDAGDLTDQIMDMGEDAYEDMVIDWYRGPNRNTSGVNDAKD